MVAVIAAGGLVIWCLWRYFLRGDDYGRGRGATRGDHGYDRYVAAENQQRSAEYQRQQVYYPGPSARGRGQGADARELEDLKRRVAYLEGQLEIIGREVSRLYGERGSNLSTPIITRHRELGQYSDSSELRGAPDTQVPDLPRGGHSTPGAAAREAYLQLSAEGLRGLPVEPIFAILDIESSARVSAIGEAKRNFRQSDSKQSAFVIFSDGAASGWLFPNPKISFTESMKYVFPELGYENFESAKGGVAPKRVRAVSTGEWEVVTE